MIELRSAGTLMNIPDCPGVYVIVCTYMGATKYRLGNTLYIGLSNSLRRRIAYALAAPGKSAPHSVQEPLMEFQNAGGIAHLMYCPLESEDNLAPLEASLLHQFEARKGTLPAWNKTRGRRKPSVDDDLAALADEILDKLGV